MPGFALPQPNREQWTFSIALALLGAIGAAQLLGFLYIVTRQPSERMASTRKSAIEAQLFRNSKMRRQSTAPVEVPAVAGVPPATVQRVPAEPTSVAETLLHVAKDFRERGGDSQRTRSTRHVKRPKLRVSLRGKVGVMSRVGVAINV